MAQITLRIPDDMHTSLKSLADKNNVSLNEFLITQLCSDRDIYQTNYDGRIQLNFNQTYLGDLLSTGQINSFDSAVMMMKDALQNNVQVRLEKHWTNSLPEVRRIFQKTEEIDKWAAAMSEIHK